MVWLGFLGLTFIVIKFHLTMSAQINLLVIRGLCFLKLFYFRYGPTEGPTPSRESY